MAKNVVVLADGTGQKGGRGHNTNIYRMYSMLVDRTPDQAVFYDAGVGTGRRKLTGNATGRGFSQKVRNAYQFIFEQYQIGDRIFLIGFSRGAATVRSLASFLDHFGILPRSRPELIDEAFGIYKKRRRRDFDSRLDTFVRGNGTHHTDIEFLGCFDTVAALGFPRPTVAAFVDVIPGFRWKFHDLDLSSNVRYAYQALAIDDERKTFHPLLWNYPPPVRTQEMKQVWFVGMHSDVGGGYQTGQHLSSIPLVWVLEQAHNRGLSIKSGLLPIYDEPDAEMHDSRGRFTTRFYSRLQRSWDSNRADHPVVHDSVVHRQKAGGLVEHHPTKVSEEPYDPWLLKLRDYQVEPWTHVESQTWYDPVAEAGR